MKARITQLISLILLLNLTACAPVQATITVSDALVAAKKTSSVTPPITNDTLSTPADALSTSGNTPPKDTQSSDTAPTPLEPELLAALQSATLDFSHVDKELATLQLSEGVWEGKPYETGFASRPTVRLYTDNSGQVVATQGDLTGDSKSEVVAVVEVASNITGRQQYLYLVLMAVGKDATLSQLAIADLGGGAKIEQIAIANGKVAVQARVVGENDAQCCPTTALVMHYIWADNALLPLVETLPGTDGEGVAQGGQMPYAQLIATATTQHGIFTIHRVKEQWYLEIPKELLGRSFYWYSELSQVSPGIGALLEPLGVGLGSIGEKMVSFEQIGERVIVNELSSVAGKRGVTSKDGSLDRAVAESALPTVLFSLPILSKSPQDALVVDLGMPLQNDFHDFSVASLLQFFGDSVDFDPSRSFIKSMDAYPNNIGVSSLLTFRIRPTVMGNMGMMIIPPSNSQSVLLRHNITLLPETPMVSRYADSRVGYFSLAYEDYSGARTPDVEVRQLITRFRLEKKDASAQLSEPIQPIIFYISREVPLRWRSYIKKGVEDWQPAFEAAGFKNAILAKDAPSPEEDPTWDPADTRYSIIRWVAQPIANAMGPSTVDPRSGEILSAHVQIFADILDLIQQWYFVQASAVDEQARTLPLPDEITGAGLRFVVAHEVGHALGLKHNHKASQAYTIQQLRDPEFTSQHGTVASIMSYGRFNYVAQPGDGVSRLIPILGPYDHFVIQWGYQPISDAKSPEDELVTLDKWAARQIDEPWLRFGGEDWAAWADPTVLTENIGDDRIEATRLGIQNLHRVMGYLLSASTRTGSDFSLLQKSYQTVMGQRYNWLSSVVKLIGGVEETRTLAGRGDVQFHRLPKAQQQAALQFVLENLQTPPDFIPGAILDQLTPIGGLESMQHNQLRLLDDLLDSSRLQRLVEGEQLGTDAYLLVDYLSELQTGLFAELKEAAPEIDPIRRALQRHYLESLQSQIDAGSNSDSRAAARWNLEKLLELVKTAETHSKNATTSAHLADLHNQIETILEGTSQGNGM